MAMAYPPSSNGDTGSPVKESISPSRSPRKYSDANGSLGDSGAPATDRYGFLGGNQYTDPDAERRLPQETLRKRETKWLDMFINWDKWMSKRFKKFSIPRQESLFEVLKAYSIHRPVEGYCQAQAPIAALLLMHMPVEQAFWCLVAICDKYLIGYYSLGLEAVQLDGDVLFGLLKKSSPTVYKHMRNQNIEPIMYMTEWFMCVFTRTLPWTVVLRLWDQFLCEGVKVLFRVGLVLLKTALEGQEKLSQCPSFFDTLERLRFRNLPPEFQDEEYIFRESLRLGITERDMEKEHLKQIKRRKAAREAKEKEALSSSHGGSDVRRGHAGGADVRHKRRT
uniref:Rab-GAP TBC domain-containing protein n=1 Tax=Biomphalaria glabrata TaxID=6526 RepID=A0A2C9K6B0_BIOGL